MNKLLKVTLITAIMATSGMAGMNPYQAQGFDPSGAQNPGEQSCSTMTKVVLGIAGAMAVKAIYDEFTDSLPAHHPLSSDNMVFSKPCHGMDAEVAFGRMPCVFSPQDPLMMAGPYEELNGKFLLRVTPKMTNLLGVKTITELRPGMEVGISPCRDLYHRGKVLSVSLGTPNAGGGNVKLPSVTIELQDEASLPAFLAVESTAVTELRQALFTMSLLSTIQTNPPAFVDAFKDLEIKIEKMSNSENIEEARKEFAKMEKVLPAETLPQYRQVLERYIALLIQGGCATASLAKWEDVTNPKAMRAYSEEAGIKRELSKSRHPHN